MPEVRELEAETVVEAADLVEPAVIAKAADFDLGRPAFGRSRPDFSTQANGSISPRPKRGCSRGQGKDHQDPS